MRKVPEHTFSLCSFLYTHPTDKSIRGEIKFFYHNIKTLPSIGISRAILKMICVDKYPDLIILTKFRIKNIIT